MPKRGMVAVLFGIVALATGCVESPAPISPPLSAPQVSEDPLPLDGDGCPTRPQALKFMKGDAPGPLIAADGVTAVTLCELAGVKRTNYPADFGKPRKLTTKLTEMVTVLNALPDRNCRLAFSDGRTRYGFPSPIDTFLGFYREQLAAVGASPVPDRPCPGAIDPARLDGRTYELMDGIGRNRGDDGPYLPSPLTAITICRYQDARLVANKTVRGKLGPAQASLNASIGGKQTSDCGNPNNPGWQPTTLDMLWVADATGAVSEIRVWRAPCTAVRAFYYDGYVAPPELPAQIDAWLRS